MSRADLVLHWPHTAESICWGVIPLISKCEPCAHRGLLGLQFRRPGSPAWLIPPSPYFPFILRATCCIYKSRAHSYSQPSIIYMTLVFSFDSSTIMKLAREIFTSSVRLMRRESKEKYPFLISLALNFWKRASSTHHPDRILINVKWFCDIDWGLAGVLPLLWRGSERWRSWQIEWDLRMFCALGFGACEASLAYFVISRCLWCSRWKCFTEEVKCLEYKCKNDSGNPLAFPFRY